MFSLVLQAWTEQCLTAPSWLWQLVLQSIGRFNMMDFLQRRSEAIQALGAVITAIVAILALIGVKLQVDASYDVQREQSAKEIYREMLNISIANPDYALPDYCALKASPRRAAYEAYVDYMLYTAEQVIEIDAEWKSVMEQHMEVHRDFICSTEDREFDGTPLGGLVKTFKSQRCQDARSC